MQWAHLSGYRRHGDRYLRTFEDSGRAITDADHLPRSLLGEYLSWVYRRVVGLLPAHVGVYHHKTRVVDIARHDGGFELALENGARRAADYVFLTTGHGYRKPSAEDRQFLSFVERRRRVNPSLEYYPSPYPIHALAQIPATATVGIQGFGLTAHDVIAALTTGRGGRYVEDAAGDLRYQRSGKEPGLLLFSRNCLPFAARGINQKGLTGRHQARYFTPQAVQSRRQARIAASGDGRLDFQEDAAPDHPGNGLCASRRRHWSRGGCRHVRAQPGRARRHRGHPVAAAQASVRVAGRVPGFFDALVRADLREAEAGNLGSPVKAATDVLRDTREALRSAVEYGGLTPASHRYFVEEFNAVTNRISFGPPRRRNLEYLALHAAGIIDIAGGPGPGCERTRPARGSASKRAMASAWKPARRTCSSWPGWMPILR